MLPFRGEAAVDEAPDERARGFRFNGGAEGEHDFTHLPFFQTLGEPIELEAFGAQVIERSQQAAQNKVAALVERAFFQREHTVPFRDHAQQRVVAFLVRTDVAGIGFRQCPAAGAQPQVVAQVVDALAEPPRFGFREAGWCTP